MDVLIAGFASGAFMAQVFIMVGCVMAFFWLKRPSAGVSVMLARFPPGVFVMAAVVFAYPAWGVVGIVLAFLFATLRDAAPGGGLGSPNMVYTAGVCVALVALAAPLIVLARRLWPGVVCIALAAVAIFGWMLPIFAS